ncbi:hypothetical protein SAMN02745157_2531 [Kaistia soli DSM 19436]|uniref:Uncharacterized protein n=1 Tax=Kaistia soli DSM 19436 TaxID=1122133 RepID=A0A1M5D1Q6_9HYPH|nr:hypothetical protein [Kaistia soli]SHF60820.1 hypothetical protein SAMN02745157_2531 [Kaistia soli DSM 19436]
MGFYAKVIRRSGGGLKKLFVPKRRRSIVKVGFPAGEVKSSVIMRAIYNEFGTRGSGKGFKTERGGGFGGPIPERPFLRNAMRENRDAYRAAMRAAARRIFAKKLPVGEELRRLGVKAQGDVQKSIQTLTSPPNSPLTIALKGSDKPLIDTGEMGQAVTFKVEE